MRVLATAVVMSMPSTWRGMVVNSRRTGWFSATSVGSTRALPMEMGLMGAGADSAAYRAQQAKARNRTDRMGLSEAD